MNRLERAGIGFVGGAIIGAIPAVSVYAVEAIHKPTQADIMVCSHVLGAAALHVTPDDIPMPCLPLKRYLTTEGDRYVLPKATDLPRVISQNGAAIHQTDLGIEIAVVAVGALGGTAFAAGRQPGEAPPMPFEIQLAA